MFIFENLKHLRIIMRILIVNIGFYFIAFIAISILSLNFACQQNASTQGRNSEINTAIPLSNRATGNIESTPIKNESSITMLNAIPKLTKSELKQGQKSIIKEIFSQIHSQSRLFGLSDLKNTRFFPEDKEIRLWVGFGLLPMRGFILSYKNDKWLAYQLISEGNRTKSSLEMRVINSPKSGWNDFSKYMVEVAISLNSGNHNESNLILDPDEEIIVVESKFGTKYNLTLLPSQNQLSLNICKKIAEEFELNLSC